MYLKVIRREWFDISRSDTFRIVPLGDIHIGSAACDETLFRSVVKGISEEKNTYWGGVGDYCDFINLRDPRFSPSELADWIKVSDLSDLAKAQRDRFLDIMNPIAHKCLWLTEGNHESAITKHYERNIYSEIVTGIKERGQFPPDHRLGLGFYGWLQLVFYQSKKKRAGASTITVNIHHGFVGGRLAGAKALNMQRWLWSHDADLVIFGHSHNTSSQIETVERLNRGGKVTYHKRIGVFSGTFLKTTAENTTTYAERRGYFPMPTSHVEILLKPGDKDPSKRIRIIS